MVDTRDIAEVAASQLLLRERSDEKLPREVVELVGPDSLTGPGLATLWTEVLGRTIRYAGDDLAAMEQKMNASAPGWLAYDMRLMMNRYQQDGAIATASELDHLTTLLGHAPRSYRDFANATAKEWQSA